MDIARSNYEVYLAYIKMYNSYSVKELAEIAKRMKVVGRSTMKKVELIHSIVLMVLDWSDEAFRENDSISAVKRVVTIEQDMVSFRGMTFKKRVAAYNRQNGKVGLLTPRQQRRIVKKWKHGIKGGHSLETLMGV